MWVVIMLHGAAALEAGRQAEADAWYESAVKVCEDSVLGGERFAHSLYSLGVVRQAEGRLEEAENLMRRALGVFESPAVRKTAEIVDAWRTLATNYSSRRLYQKAESAARRALEIETAAAVPRADRVVGILSTLAAILLQQSRYAESAEALERAEGFLERVPQHSLLHALLLNNLGGLQRRIGHDAKAVNTFSRGVALVDRTTDPWTLVLAVQLWCNLGVIYYEQKQYARAAEPLSRAVEAIDKGAPLGSELAASVLRAYALCLRKVGGKARARQLEARATALESSVPTGP
jgi:tetratricopeptide (TPR) repeat protein